MVARLEPGRRVVADEQRADRQPVCESLRQRDQVRPDTELLEGEERPRAADAGLHLVEAEQCAMLGRELRRGGEEAARRGIDAALALDGLDEDQRRVGADGRLERGHVVQLREGDPGQERLERGPLRRLARRRQRAERPSVERALERDDAGLARRLARVLDRRLDRLGTRVAEERLRAAEALGEQVGKPGHRLAPVEVRDMPESVELLVRGGERRRMAMSEADDGDARREVEVTRPVGGGQPRAVAVDERDVGADVCREHRAARGERHEVTSVRPISARTPRLAATTAACSFGTIPPSKQPASTSSAPM